MRFKGGLDLIIGKMLHKLFFTELRVLSVYLELAGQTGHFVNKWIGSLPRSDCRKSITGTFCKCLEQFLK